MNVVIQGILLGLVLSTLIGPIFFVIIETSLKDGIRSAFFLDLGVILSDVFYLLVYFILIIYFGVDLKGFRESDYLYLLYLIGGVMFVSLSLIKIFKIKVKDTHSSPSEVEIKEKNTFKLVATGFLLNVINPGVMVYWLLAAIYAISQFGENYGNIMAYFGITLAVYFSIDILKIYTARQFKKLSQPKNLKIMNFVVGSIYGVCGVGLLVGGISMLREMF